MAADRTASATWNGNLTEGSGQIHSFGSGALGELPVTWAARSQESNGQTSPEELIAAAHASCFSMAFANMLFKKGFTAEQLDTTATVTFVPGTGITTSNLSCAGASRARPRMSSSRPPRTRGPTAPSRRRSRASRSRSTRPSSVASLHGRHREPRRRARALLPGLQERMSDPAVYNDHREAADVGRRLKELEGAVQAGAGVAGGASRPRRGARRQRAARARPGVRATRRRGRGGAQARPRRARPRGLEGRDRRGAPGRRRRRGGPLGRRRLPHAHPLRRAARLQVGAARRQPERGGRLQRGHLRGEGRRGVLGLQVGGRHPPRPARSRRRSRRGGSTPRRPRSR